MKTMGNHELLKKNEEIILAREIQVLIKWEETREELETKLMRYVLIYKGYDISSLILNTPLTIAFPVSQTSYLCGMGIRSSERHDCYGNEKTDPPFTPRKSSVNRIQPSSSD